MQMDGSSMIQPNKKEDPKAMESQHSSRSKLNTDVMTRLAMG